MEEQLELVEKLKVLGIEMSPEERLESIDEIEKFIQTLDEIDRTLEHTRKLMLEGKVSPDGPFRDRYLEDYIDDARYDDDAIVLEILLFVIFVATAAAAENLVIPICGIIALIAYTAIVIWQNSPFKVISGLLRRRLVRSTKAYGQIIEAQVGLKRLSIKMKLKQTELLIKRV